MYDCNVCGGDLTCMGGHPCICKPNEKSMKGCKSHECILSTPEGMGTNSRCTCLDGIDRNLSFAIRRKFARENTELSIVRNALDVVMKEFEQWNLTEGEPEAIAAMRIGREALGR